MADIKFTSDHEWLRPEGDDIVVGISNYAQEQLGDLVFVELPDVGKSLARGDEAAVVESVKAASEVYAPISGEITAVNTALGDDPAKVNSDAEGEGWLFRIKASDAGEMDGLMDASAYAAHIASLD